MDYLFDIHTHTLASGHAYATLLEMVQAAKDAGLSLLAVTDHAPAMPGSCHRMHFEVLRLLPREILGLPVLHGVEANLVDGDGGLDLKDSLLAQMDVVIASIHGPCFPTGDTDFNTQAILRVMDNPYVNIIGHPDDSRAPLHYEPIVKKAKEKGILLEVNNSSMAPKCFRQNARENYRTMLELCKKYQVPIVVNSDAHFVDTVGSHQYAYALLEEVSFPEELVVNTSFERLRPFLNERVRDHLPGVDHV